MNLRVWYLFIFCLPLVLIAAPVKVGADLLFEKENRSLIKDKRIGLITNQSAVNQKLRTTFDLLKENQEDYKLVAVFAPEHGFYGDAYACETIGDQIIEGIPLYGLHGATRRPNDAMLASVDLLIYDIQDIGSRSYTFASTLFYCMEEAAKRSIPVLILDRPNPMGGLVVDGPLVEEKWRSFLGYLNVPYCHGMTLGELALLFNEEYHIGCTLKVIPMEGWKRGMVFAETGLPWVPTSPQIPEPDTPFFYPSTGLIGHCSITSIGIGYTLPFKLVGAPWIDAERFAKQLNELNLPGVQFQPYYFRPFFGKFKLENCKGVRILVADAAEYLPVTTQFAIMGVLKQLYPEFFDQAMSQVFASKNKQDVFNKLNGSEEILRILSEEKYTIWKLRTICAEARQYFLPIRKKYLIASYS